MHPTSLTADYLSMAAAPPGRPLYARLKSGLEYERVLQTAVEDCGVDSLEDARDLMDAFLQWFSVAPARDPGSTYVMLKSDVDRIFHAFVLNTRAYRELCEKYIGHFMDHNPLDGAISKSCVESTIELLERHFGTDLHPALRRWKELTHTDAWRVSCGW